MYTLQTNSTATPITGVSCSVNLDICQRCGSLNLEIGAGKGPHFAALQCKDCGRHVKWLSQRQAKALEGKIRSAHKQLSLLEGGEA